MSGECLDCGNPICVCDDLKLYYKDVAESFNREVEIAKLKEQLKEACELIKEIYNQDRFHMDYIERDLIIKTEQFLDKHDNK
jgi:hypothetical protein